MKYFPALTGLRALAAYLVFFHHFNLFLHYDSLSFIARMVDEFYIGVTIFFVLSGFLISYRYYGQQKLTRPFWLNYIKNRFARIYPMYFILTTITFIYIVVSGEANFSTGENIFLYFLNISFLKGFFDSFKFNGIIQAWTLTVEECFYLIAPLLFVFVKGARKWILFILSTYAVGVLLFMSVGRLDIYGFFRNFQFTFAYTIFGRIFEFAVGIWLALKYKKNPVEKRSAVVYTLTGLLVILVSVFLLAEIKAVFNVQQGIYHPLGIAVNNLFLPIGVGFLIFGLIVEKNWLSAMLSTKYFDLLGKSSYTFYLIHMGVVYNLIMFLIPIDFSLIPFIILNIISILLYKYLETPLNIYFRNLRFNSTVNVIRNNA